MIEILATDLEAIHGGADSCAVTPGTTRDQYTRSAVGDYLRAGALGGKLADRLKYQFDSDPGNLDRYTNAIRSRPSGEAYLSALRCRDAFPTK